MVQWNIIYQAIVIGFVTLSLEILAPRLISPFLGNSDVTWTFVITSFLFGLSYGAFSATKNILTLKKVYFLLVVSFVPLFLYTFVYSLIVSLSIPYLSKVLLSSLLFVPAAFLLGMTAPLLIKMTKLDALQASGKISSLITFGSIVGGILTGVYLLSVFNHYQILALLLFLVISLTFTHIKHFAISIFIGFGLFLLADNGYKSPYQHLRVVDEQNKVTLFSGVVALSFHDRDNKQMQKWVYIQDFINYSKEFLNNEKSVLNICMGGGSLSIAQNELYPEASITNIELDPVVVTIAREVFEVPKSVKIINQDARYFLNIDKTKYDLITLDCSKSFVNPPHLLTQEFYQLLKDRLKPNGVLMTHLIETIGSDYPRKVATVAYPFEYSYYAKAGRADRIIISSERKLEKLPNYKLVNKEKYITENKLFTDHFQFISHQRL